MEGKMNTKAVLRQNAIWLVFLVEVIFFAIFSHGTFVTPNNITNILRQVSYYGIASVGMTFVILIAGIDLSIGSIITLVNMVCAVENLMHIISNHMRNIRKTDSSWKTE